MMSPILLQAIFHFLLIKLCKGNEKVKLSDVSDTSSSDTSLSSSDDDDDEEDHLAKEPRKRKKRFWPRTRK